MIGFPLNSGADVLTATGVHPDRWCEPFTSARLRSTTTLVIGTAGIWIRPDDGSSSTVRLAIQVDREHPFVCDLSRDRPTYIGFSVDRAATETFVLSLQCDSRVKEKGSDKRDLSFVLSSLALTGDEQVPCEAQHADSRAFAEFMWTARTALRGQLLGVQACTQVKAYIGSNEVAQTRTDEVGLFELAISHLVSGHRPRTLRIAADNVSIEIDVILDPQLLGEQRQQLSLPAAQDSSLVPVTEALDFARSIPSARQVNASEGEWLQPLLQSMMVQTQALQSLVCSNATGAQPLSSSAQITPPAMLLRDRYGPLIDHVNPIHPKYDIIWLGVIDWNFRLQRPQHLAIELARHGCRVFYISIVFGSCDYKGRFEIIKSPEHGVYEVRLKLGCKLPDNIYRVLDVETVKEILLSIDEMTAMLSISSPTVVVEYPSWVPVAFGIPGATVVHDCLDLVSGFDNTPGEIVELEHQLVSGADIVVTTSQPLHDLLAQQRSSTIIRNGADVQFFRQAANLREPSPYKGKVIGYFGAIAHWFEMEWVVRAAEDHPDWTIVLIGATDGADLKTAAKYSNVVLLGERPYTELITHLAYFDVAIIPFKLLDLILCTNPVKLYEYMAAGKPVVASAMPEVVAATELVYIAKDEEDFVAKIERALLEDKPKLRRARMRWAEQNAWESRALLFQSLLDTARPKVSVIILSYKQWSFTEATIWSVLAFSDYDNLEIIVVDNGSGDDIVEKLRQFALRDSRIKLILSDKNLGYSAGNNLGFEAATGEYLILLNNDTYVTRGWVKDLIRPLQMDHSIGLVSPLTNNIGNEQKININYGNMEEMAHVARDRVRQHARQRLDVDCVAFFCVATRRDVVEEIGFLDETYGLGFFEDDDYCKRVLKHGYRIQIADDVFIHHHLSASFDQLGSEKKNELMARNKSIFEERWGEWKPHEHRKAPGFG